jgi:hypothetical protein
MPAQQTTSSPDRKPKTPEKCALYLVEEEYLVTAFVPSETACLASSPGRINRTLEMELVNDKSDANATRLTRSGSLATRWWTSCCMQQAWRPQWRRAQRCLNWMLELDASNSIDQNIPLTKEFKMDMARLEIPVSG